MLENPIKMGEFKMAHKKKSHIKSKHSDHVVRPDGIVHGGKGLVMPLAHEKGKKHHSRGK